MDREELKKYHREAVILYLKSMGQGTQNKIRANVLLASRRYTKKLLDEMMEEGVIQMRLGGRRSHVYSLTEQYRKNSH